VKNIPYFRKKYFVDQIVLFGYYLQKKENYDSFSIKNIEECFSLSASPSPTNFSDLFKRLSKVNRIIPKNNTWVLSGLEEENIEENELGLRSLTTVKDELRTLPEKFPDVQQKFVNEILGCLQVQAWRGVIVLTWILTIDHLQKIILSNNLEKFNEILSETRAYHDTVITQIEDFEKMKDIDFLRTVKTCGIISGSQFNILETRLKERNRYAHPTNLEITDTIATAFLEDLINNIILKITLGNSDQ
jgi:hypothetical protein